GVARAVHDFHVRVRPADRVARERAVGRDGGVGVVVAVPWDEADFGEAGLDWTPERVCRVAAEHEPDTAEAAHLDVLDASVVESRSGHGDVGVERDAVAAVACVASRTDDDQPAQAHPARVVDEDAAAGAAVDRGAATAEAADGHRPAAGARVLGAAQQLAIEGGAALEQDAVAGLEIDLVHPGERAPRGGAAVARRGVVARGTDEVRGRGAGLGGGHEHSHGEGRSQCSPERATVSRSIHGDPACGPRAPRLQAPRAASFRATIDTVPSGSAPTLTPWPPSSAPPAGRRSRRRSARRRGASAPPVTSRASSSRKGGTPQIVEAGAMSRYGRTAGW